MAAKVKTASGSEYGNSFSWVLNTWPKVTEIYYCYIHYQTEQLTTWKKGQHYLSLSMCLSMILSTRTEKLAGLQTIWGRQGSVLWDIDFDVSAMKNSVDWQDSKLVNDPQGRVASTCHWGSPLLATSDWRHLSYGCYLINGIKNHNLH